MNRKIFLAVFITVLTSCTNNNQHPLPDQENNTTNPETTLTEIKEEGSKRFELICDSIYKNKAYKITLTRFDTANMNETIPNTILGFSKLTNGQYLPLFADSIFNTTQEIRFTDFNNDKIPDILVQHFSDVRSNLSYYLYLVDTTQNNLRKIKGFEEIKNPHYLPQYNLIDNYVMSGQIWTSFYKIKGDSVKNFDIVIYDNQTEDGSYDRDYKKALNSVLNNTHEEKTLN